MNGTRGIFITLEGGEGVGKTTNLAFIRNYLSEREVRFIVTREPGGTPVGEEIRRLFLNSQTLEAETELLLLFAARSQHIKQVIKPALDEGVWVICDRFTDASYAYQGAGRGIDNAVIAFLENWVQNGIRPNLTLLFDAPAEIGLARAQRRGNIDRFEAEVPVFFTRVRDAYLKLAAQFPERIQLIDASKPLSEVQANIKKHLKLLLPK